MQLTGQQVLSLAPDSGSAASGRKLANAAQWPLLGRSSRAIWGECQGSGKTPYQIRVDLTDLANKCSCPSRKFTCKHVIGLFLLTANQPDNVVAHLDESEWIAEWLEKRMAKASQSVA